MTAQERFEELVRDGVWPFLRGHGFKRMKATFHRPVGDNWQVVNLQKSRHSDRRAIEFTVNVAVGLDRLREGVYDWPDGKRPAESACHFRERLGFLLRGEDVWWEVGRRTDLGALADAIATALEQYAFPWLDERSTDDALLALMRTPERLRAQPLHHLHWLVTLAEQLGDPALVQAVVAERDRREAALRERRRG